MASFVTPRARSLNSCDMRAVRTLAETRLKDGITRGYFKREDCQKALLLAKRCGQAILKLLKSLGPFLGD